MKCPNCGDSNPSNARFCQKCGKAMGRKFPTAAVVLLLVVGGAVALGFVFRRESSAPTETPPKPQVAALPQTDKPTLGVAYGSEKENWLKWAAAEFGRTPAGQRFDIDLIKLGSLEGAQAIVDGNQKIHVWSPASSMPRDLLVRDFKARHRDVDPIASEARLALTPMVFMMWRERHDAFVSRFGQVNFRTIAQAAALQRGWAQINDRDTWGPFQFSFTDPNRSNSGLTALLVMGYDFHAKSRGLAKSDIVASQFVSWMSEVGRNLAASNLIHSTGTLVDDMIGKGPGTYDAVFVYESNAIEKLGPGAAGRYGTLRIAYPTYNFWNDHPYYILNVSWSTPQHREAAKAFQDFLLSDLAQTKALEFGFRPGRVEVPINAADSPFVRHADLGLQIDVPGTFCDPPKAEVMDELRMLWTRSRN